MTSITYPEMKAADVQGWITAFGTLLAGVAAILALWFGAVQFRRAGFVYRTRLMIDEDNRVMLVSVQNTGRTQGQIVYIEVQNRRSVRIRISLALRRHRGEFEVITAEMWPAVKGSRTRTTGSTQTPTGAVSIDLPSGHTFVTYLMRPRPQRGSPNGMINVRDEHPPFVSSAGDDAQKKRWLLVQVGFGDGRIASNVPRRMSGIYQPVGIVHKPQP